MYDLKDKKVLVMGLGKFGGGVGVSRFCHEAGANVTVTDMLGRHELHESVEKLADVPVRYHLGGHNVEDFTSADLVVVNPAVDRRNNAYLHAAERAGVPLTSEIQLLVERLDRNRVIGITGSAGKSTTTAMIGHALSASFGAGRVHVGGNIGGSLLGELANIRPDHWVVLELSSFMLETMGDFSPHIAVVTNISDNHLDRHGHLDSYVKAKKTILRHQRREDRAVLGTSAADWRFDTSAVSLVVDDPLDAELKIPGDHNRLNAAYALAACECAGAPREKAVAALRNFTGLQHRLQFILERAGVRFYNDSKSTTPESSVLAINAFEPGQVHIILGGFDKKADLTAMARYAAQKCAGIYTIGQTGEAVAQAAEAAGGHCAVHRCGILEVAMKEAVRRALPEQVVLLSPGCASYDQFTHYEARGRLFAEFALRYTTETA